MTLAAPRLYAGMVPRERITEALAALPGITASSSTPDTITAGMAWPAWASTRWRNQQPQGAREVRWFVYVALPGATHATAVDAADPLIEEVGQALADAQLTVELVDSVRVQVAPGGTDTIPALRFTLVD